MSHRPTLSFQLRPTQKFSNQLKKISGVIFSMAFLCAIPWLQMVPDEGSFQVKGKLHVPEKETFVSLSDINILAYRDEDRNGKIGKADLLISQTYTDDSGEFVFQIEEGQSFITHIQEEADDAWEATANGKVFSTAHVRLSSEESGGTLLSGFRFREVHIPSDAIITAAAIQLAASKNVSTPQLFSIFAEQAIAPLPFSKDHGNLSKRELSPAYHDWIIPSMQRGKKYQSPDLSSLIHSLIHQENWQSGQPMVFLLEGDTWLGNTRDEQGIGARLVVHYVLPDQPLILMVDSTSLPEGVSFPPMYASRRDDASIMWKGNVQDHASHSPRLGFNPEPDDSPLFLALDQTSGSESLTLRYRARFPEGVQLEVINMAGQSFQRLPVQGSANIQTLTLWTTFWPKGLYYLHLYHENSSIMKPYVVK